MERLSHDLNLALEESNCRRDTRRRFGSRRRTRSAGNLPAAVAISPGQDDSSSSPPQAVVTHPSDSDDPHTGHNPAGTSRRDSKIVHIESDSFNETCTPARANTRRKRKYKKVPVDCPELDSTCSPSVPITFTTEVSLIPIPSTSAQSNTLSTLKCKTNKSSHSRERCSTISGKRKWSQTRGEATEMRERSFSGGCASRLSLPRNFDFVKKNVDKRRREAVLAPGKIMLPTPAAASFRFHPRPPAPGAAAAAFSAAPALAARAPVPILASVASAASLRDPFEELGSMECGSDTSSISSSDPESLVTNDSDREGDDELTDWPGIEELKVFNKTLSFRASKPAAGQPMPPPKRLKKEKLLAKSGWASCKNKFQKKRAKVDSDNENESFMSDSATITGPARAEQSGLRTMNLPSFRDIKRAGAKGENANESFYRSFRAFEEEAACRQTAIGRARSISPQLVMGDRSGGGGGDDRAVGFGGRGVGRGDRGGRGRAGTICAVAAELARQEREAREIRAGCRRGRGARPALLIQSGLAEQLSQFLQDARASELQLPTPALQAEAVSLRDLAELYSLELRADSTRIVLKKTSKTTQAVQVEQSYAALVSHHKRRCYDECPCSEATAAGAAAGAGAAAARALREPGELA